MPRITVQEAQAWAESTKLRITVLDSDLLTQVETRVVSRLASAFPDTYTTWVAPASTPDIVRVVIAMYYVAWFYDRQYSEEQESLNDYAVLLRTQADELMTGILDGSIVVPGVPIPGVDGPAFYPDDASSSLCPTDLDRSLGDAKFSMNQVF